VRQGRTLTALARLDANHNPADAFLNEKRLFVNAGHDRATSFGTWNTTVAFTRSSQDVLRGFLADMSDSAPNAAGFRAEIGQADVYFDTHLTWTASPRVKGVLGFDHLHGNAEAEGDVFDYFVRLDGSGAPTGVRIPREEDRRIENRRDFSGLYGFVEWNPAGRVSLEAGARLNRTDEEREEGDAADAGAGGNDKKDVFRASGSVAAAYTAWEQGTDRVRLFANYKNSFKPAAVDFNLQEGEAEAGGGILEPETAHSFEGGVKARLAGGRLSLEASAFLMDFRNLVISQVVAGLPALRNAGRERFKGVEVSGVGRVAADLYARASYAWHDARFRDFLTEFDGQPTQLAGKRLKMSAHHLAAGALTYAPVHGLVGSIEGHYVGSRFLNKRNTALADGYLTCSASVGWRESRWEARLSGRNLSDRRDPVAESELGDAQYYRLPARRFDASVRVTFRWSPRSAAHPIPAFCRRRSPESRSRSGTLTRIRRPGTVCIRTQPEELHSVDGTAGSAGARVGRTRDVW
jgi:iron complex outermembrane receptor protein